MDLKTLGIRIHESDLLAVGPKRRLWRLFQYLDAAGGGIQELQRGSIGDDGGAILLMVQKSGSPVEVGSLPHYLQGFIHPRWCRISSINSMTQN